MATLNTTKRGIRSALSGLALLLVFTGPAVAQSEYELDYMPPGPFHSPTPLYAPDMFHTYHHDSTFPSALVRARAALLYSQGAYLVNHNQALILHELARWMYLRNRVEVTRSLYARLELQRVYREQQRMLRQARIAAGLASLAERQRTYYHTTYRLSPSELDLATGWITWPEILEHSKYSDYREQVDELYRIHLGYGDPQVDTAARIVDSVESWEKVLRHDRVRMPREVFLAAQKFLRGLKYEAASIVNPGDSTVMNIAMEKGRRG